MTAMLVDHLWQSTLFAGLAALAALALRDHGAHVRYWVWFAASVKFLVPFAALAALGRSVGWTTATTDFGWAGAWTQPMTAFASAPREGFPMGEVLLSVWLAGSASVLGIWLVRWMRLHAAVRGSRSLQVAHLIGASVEVRETAGVGPGVVGFIRPILVVPKGIVDGVDVRHLRPVLEHELCHLSRQDNLTALVQMIVEVVFWFHPLVWWIGARLIAERERACDEHVVAAGTSPEAYAESIIEVCRFHVDARLPCAAGIGNAKLKARIEGIVANRRLRELSGGRRAMLIAAAAASLFLPIALGACQRATDGPGVSESAPPALEPEESLPAEDMPRTQIRCVVGVGGEGCMGVAWWEDGAEVEEQIAPLVRIPPDYPPRALAEGIEGWVLVEFTITSTGSVANPVVVRSSPPVVFDAAAIQAISRWRFNPRVIDGRAIERVGFRTQIDFELTD